jgi:hypothetical protein
LQTIRFLDAEIKQPLLRYAQGIFAINVKHRALLDFEIRKRPVLTENYVRVIQRRSNYLGRRSILASC